MKVYYIKYFLNFNYNIELTDSSGEIVLGGSRRVYNPNTPINDLPYLLRSCNSERSAKWFTNFNHELLNKIRNYEYTNS